MIQKTVICDPQTSRGRYYSISPSSLAYSKACGDFSCQKSKNWLNKQEIRKATQFFFCKISRVDFTFHNRYGRWENFKISFWPHFVRSSMGYLNWGRKKVKLIFTMIFGALTVYLTYGCWTGSGCFARNFLQSKIQSCSKLMPQMFKSSLDPIFCLKTKIEVCALLMDASIVWTTWFWEVFWFRSGRVRHATTTKRLAMNT